MTQRIGFAPDLLLFGIGLKYSGSLISSFPTGFRLTVSSAFAEMAGKRKATRRVRVKINFFIRALLLEVGLAKLGERF